MRLFNGKKVANKILRDLKAEINKKKIQPNLAVVLVGNDEPSKIYVRLKKEAGKKIGIKVDVFEFSAQAKEINIIKKIKEFNKNKNISGIIVQLPLPPKFNKEKITSVIDPQKDVDGFHRANQKLLAKGKAKFVPPLPAAILLAIKEPYLRRHPEWSDSEAKDLTAGAEILLRQPADQNDKEKELLKNKKAIALVNSDIFGRMLKLVLEKTGMDFKYLLQKACSLSGGNEELKSADIIITACGCPNLVRGEMIKQGAIVIDAGITHYHNKKVVGDVNRKEIQKKAGFLTPVPGGIGPVAVALLLKNVYLAVEK